MKRGLAKGSYYKSAAPSGQLALPHGGDMISIDVLLLPTLEVAEKHAHPDGLSPIIEAQPGVSYHVRVRNVSNTMLYIKASVDGLDISSGYYKCAPGNDFVYRGFISASLNEVTKMRIDETRPLSFASPTIHEGGAPIAPAEFAALGKILVDVRQATPCACNGLHASALGGTSAVSNPVLTETKKAALGVLCTVPSRAVAPKTSEAAMFFRCDGYVVGPAIGGPVMLRYASRVSLLMAGVLQPPKREAPALVCVLGDDDDVAWGDVERPPVPKKRRAAPPGEPNKIAVCELDGAGGDAGQWSTIDKADAEPVEL